MSTPTAMRRRPVYHLLTLFRTEPQNWTTSRQRSTSHEEQSFPEQTLNLALNSELCWSVESVLQLVITNFKGHKWNCPPILSANLTLLCIFLASRPAFVVVHGRRLRELAQWELMYSRVELPPPSDLEHVTL